jgi:ferritin
MYNSAVYLYFMAFLRNKGLNNLADFFEKQHEEEQGHAKMIIKLLTDLNVEVQILPVNGYNKELPNILILANEYMSREVETTNSLTEIKDICIAEGASVAEEAIRRMIHIQQNEYEEAFEFSDKAEKTGGDWWRVMQWDLSVGK